MKTNLPADNHSPFFERRNKASYLSAFSFKKRTPRPLFCLCLCFILLLVCGCTKKGQEDGRTLTVSIEPLRYVAEAVAGDKYRVEVMMPRGASPETYEPTPRQMVGLSHSTALLRCGTLGFEQTRLPKMAETIPDTPMYDLGEGIKPIVSAEHTHDDGETGESLDPHIWTSPENLKVMAENLCRILCATDSVNAPYYNERLARFSEKMDDLDKELHTTLAKVKHRSFIIYHPALGYFARSYGLRQIAIEHDGKDLSAQSLRNIVETARAEGVRAVFISKEHSGQTARRIAEQTGTKVTEINPLDYDVAAQLRRIAHTLAQ